jgi:hypothetical protein
MSKRPSKRVEKRAGQDLELVKLCVDVTLYWIGSAHAFRDDIVGFYEGALRLIRDDLKFYRREGMDDPEPIKKATFDMLPRLLAAKPAADAYIYILDMESGAAPGVRSDRAFQLWSEELGEPPAGMVRLVLPTDFVKESPRRLLDTALALAKDFRFHSGHSGYSTNWTFRGENEDAARKQAGEVARRHPAVEIANPAATVMGLMEGFKRINWITFLGNELLAEKGLKGKKWPELDVRPLPHGLAFVAGDEPKMGGATGGVTGGATGNGAGAKQVDDLRAYHQIGKALKKARTTSLGAFIADEDGETQDADTEKWLSYFDK